MNLAKPCKERWQSPIMKTTVTKDRLKAKGYVSFSDYFFKLKSDTKEKK
jgi:hypothetical protein